MEINNLLAGCASGFGVGCLDLLMLRSASRNIVRGNNSRVYRFVIAGLMGRLLLAGALFYLFLSVVHGGCAGFLLGITLSFTAVFLPAVMSRYTVRGKTYVGNS